MKKIIFLLLMTMTCALRIDAQAIHIFHDSNPVADVYANNGVDSIKIKPIESSPEAYEYRIYTLDGLFTYPVDKVDSIKFNLPHLKLLDHNITVPSEMGDVHIYASIKDCADELYIVLPDGSKGQLGYSSNNYIQDFGFWIGYNDLNAKEEKWILTDGIFSDELNISYSGEPLIPELYYTMGYSSDASEIVMHTSFENVDLIFDSDVDWLSVMKNEHGDFVLNLSENESSETRWIYCYPRTVNFNVNAHRIAQVRKFKHTAEEHMAALRDFYESTSLHEMETNWFSDQPLWEWDFFINNHKWSDGYWAINDHVVNIYTGGGQYTGITGTLPASFEVFLDDIVDDMDGELDLTQCALYGKIPDNIKANPKWQKYGWNIIRQDPYYGGGFDMDDINLRLDDTEVTDFVNNVETTTFEVLAKNKITWIFNSGAVDVVGGISDEQVNKYLDYKDKGLGVVVTVGGFWDTPYDEYCDYVKEEQDNNGLPKEIMWTKGFDKADLGVYFNMSIVDDNGYLLWYSETIDLDKVDEVCRKYLGEPVEHAEYISSIYESTDYSEDGAILTLQQAEIGNGIDLVFTGDGFVDTDMTEGGVFETEMRNAMEYFFDIEPYRTFRNRFNVYAVKAVSKNNHRGDDHAFSYNDSKVMEYVSRIPNIDMDNVTVAVIDYDPNYQFFLSGYTNMYDTGSSIAYIQSGNASPILVHEAGGHGFAKLLDEYIYGGYEDNVIPEEYLADFRDFIKTYYHDCNWGMNVSTSSVPEETPWQEFFEDERYTDEVGIYQGAWFYPQDLWRSSENSVMNTDYSFFNVPSRKAIYERVMTLSEGDDWVYDHEEFVKFDKEVMTKEYVSKMPKKSKSETSPTIIHKSPNIIKTKSDGTTEVITPPQLKHQPGKQKIKSSINRDRKASYILIDE